MAVEKFIIDKSDLSALLRGEELAIQPRGNIRGFCVEIAGNPTNGDMIMAMFPNATFYEDTHGYGYVYSDVVRCEENYMMTYDKEWWNAPYKKESENTDAYSN